MPSAKSEIEAVGSAESSGPLATLGSKIYARPLPFLLVAPLVCLILAITGFSVLEVENSVDEIWSLTSGDYYADRQYQKSVQTTSTGNSGVIGIATPRTEGANVLTSSYMVSFASRLNATEHIQITYNDQVFTLQDVCFTALGDYSYPCYRMTSLDCFREGGYSFDNKAASSWRAMFTESAHGTGIATAKSAAVNELVATGFCPSECGLTNAELMKNWDNTSTCVSCYSDFLANNTNGQFNKMFYGALKSQFVAAGIDTAEFATVVAALAVSSACSTDCTTYDGTTYDANSGWGATTSCSGCLSSVYASLTDAQIETTMYGTVQAATGLTTYAQVDDYLEASVQTTVFAYSDAALLQIFNTNYAATITAGVASAKYATIMAALAVSTSDCSTQCTTYDGTTYDASSGWGATSTCSSCLSTAYGSLSSTEKDRTYDAAMKATYGSSLTDAQVDAITLAAVNAAIHTQIVQFATASTLCESTSGELGFCDVSAGFTGTWSTDTACQACYSAFIDGDDSAQQDMMYYSALRVSMVAAGIAQAEMESTVTYLASAVCTSDCTIDGTYAAGTWATDATCYACYSAAYATATAAQREGYYYTFMNASLSVTTYAAVDLYVSTAVKTAVHAYSSAYLDAYVSAAVLATLENYVKGKTPYTFSITDFASVGYVNARLQATGAEEADVLAAASDTCYAWDEGIALPEASKYVTLGGTTPSAEDVQSGSNPYTSAASTQVIYNFLLPKEVAARVESSARPGGNVTISTADAEAILTAMKLEFETVFSAGWSTSQDDDESGDDTDGGNLQFHAFSDDAGSQGTFGRTLKDMTPSSLGLSAVNYLVTAFVTCLALGSLRNPVASRATLGFFGALVSVLAFAASLGATALCGVRVNVVQTMTLPFVMVGLGMDDVFILALAAQDALTSYALKSQAGSPILTAAAAQKAFVAVFADVVLPITLTSLTNLCMFAILATAALPAVYLTALTAVLAVFLLYTTVLTSFAAAVALDFQRQVAQRCDVLCCYRAASSAPSAAAATVATEEAVTTSSNLADAESGEGGKASTIITGAKKDEPSSSSLVVSSSKAQAPTGTKLTQVFWKQLYKPLLQSRFGRDTVLAVAVVLVVLASIGLADLQLGLGLTEFFPQGSQAGAFAELQATYFPVWPATMNWGALQYHDPSVQLQMVQQWEAVTSTDYYTDVDTDAVWTARLAQWALPEAYSTGYCSSSNALTGGSCGPNLDASCTATWALNAYNLKLTNQGGICVNGTDLVGFDSSVDPTQSYCPMLNVTESVYAHCLSLMVKNASVLYDVLSPGIALEDDDYTVEVPIQYSRASGSVLFMYNLHDVSDYVNAIQEGRAGCDNSDGPHCWLTGIAFSFWEQYVTIDTWLVSVALLAVAVGVVASALFFYMGFRGTGVTLSGGPHNNSGDSHKINHGSSSSTNQDSPSAQTGIDQGAARAAAMGGLVVGSVSLLSQFTVIGLSCFVGVSLNGLSAMACLMSTGFSVEYAVHVVHRFMMATGKTPLDRTLIVMEQLVAPMSLSFLSSAVGIVVLVFSPFQFVRINFFVPLFVMLFANYFYGVFLLPVLCSLMPSYTATSAKSPTTSIANNKVAPADPELVEEEIVVPFSSGDDSTKIASSGIDTDSTGAAEASDGTQRSTL